MDLIEVLKEMNKEMAEKFPEINYGGCGKSSFTLLKCLLNVKGVSNAGIVMTWFRNNHDCSYNKIRKIKITDNNVLSVLITANGAILWLNLNTMGKFIMLTH